MTQQDRRELVIVGVDGSASSERALAWAARYAKGTGATMRAVLAWHYPAPVGGAVYGRTPASVTDEVENDKRNALASEIASALGDPPEVPVEQKVAYGHPAQVLIDESAGADLLVVGSKGYGGFKGMLLGSVCSSLVTHASCPVTVVRAD
jgi:nucleotide-binding universal stress UspA family protein